MKPYLITLLIIISFSKVHAQKHFTQAKDVGKHVGESVVIEDTIQGCEVTNDGFMLLYIGRKQPNQLFTVVVQRNQIKIPPAKISGYKIHIEGNVTLFNGKPEIVVSNQRYASEIGGKFLYFSLDL